MSRNRANTANIQRFVWEFNEHVIKNGIGNKNTIKMPYLVSLLCYLYLLGELRHFGAIPESSVSIKREIREVILQITGVSQRHLMYGLSH